MKIELEDLWRISPQLNKILTISTFLVCIAIAPYLRTLDGNSLSNMNILVAQNGVNLGIKNIDYLNHMNTEVISKSGIYSNDNGVCFVDESTNSNVRITCPLKKSFGAINQISEYNIKNKKISNHKYYYEPVFSAKIAISLLFWVFIFAMPIYFWTLKNADLSQIKERAGKRKLFNFKN